MDISWAWLAIGLVAGTALGLMVMGSLVEGRVLDASSAGYRRGFEHGREEGKIVDRTRLVVEQNRWEEQKQRWATLVLDLSKEVERLKATVEKFSPAKMAACSPEVERALAAVDLGKGA